ncbi:MAG: GNAT family N-acetyltransferase [Candidatus Heimdallarchaeota archaeon]
MKVEFHEDIKSFYTLVYPFLVQHEAENNIILAILNTLIESPNRYGTEKPDMVTVAKDENIKFVLIRTPPFNPILSYTDNLNIVDFLIEEFIKKGIEIPGLFGCKEIAKRFADEWCKKKDLSYKIVMNERIYKLEKVSKGALGNREYIIADKTHEDLILKWAREFITEALPHEKEDSIEKSLERNKKDIEEGRIFLLIYNGKPVSMARKAGKTPNGNLVNLVYTPPNYRRRGYATELVAHLSKHLLDEGNKYCFLFTDLMNPTSNNVYQKVGYKPITDYDQYEFE